MGDGNADGKQRAGSTGPGLCTIIAKNYVASARALCQSFLRHHPDGRCYVLVIDDYAGYIEPAKEPFEVVGLDALDIPNRRSFIFKYDVVELSTAVKPFFMEYLLREKGGASLIYLDPDIYVANPLTEQIKRLEQSGEDILVTPHIEADFPNNGTPQTNLVLKYGLYNLGFLGISARPNALAFLRWFQEKLYDNCLNNPCEGYYVDQKFADVVPLIFDRVGIERAPGCNVAYWNLHTRTLSRATSGEWLCNGEPLRFFHFSGFGPDDPVRITKSYSFDRHTLEDRPDIKPLFEEYRAALLANGFRETRTWPYTYNSFANGVAIPREVRQRYRANQARWEQYGDPFASAELLEAAAAIGRRERLARLRTRIGVRHRVRKMIKGLLAPGGGSSAQGN